MKTSLFPIENIDKARKTHEQLSEKIKDANDAYYQHDDPIMDDSEYDRYKRELDDLERDFPSLKQNSISQQVGAAPQAKFAKITHKVAMLSLGNAFDDDDVREFDQSIKRFLKFDSQLRNLYIHSTDLAQFHDALFSLFWAFYSLIYDLDPNPLLKALIWPVDV